MTRAIGWFVRNPVAANLLMLLLVGGGLVAMPQIPQKTFPDIDIDVVTVSVAYLGASPEEVEEAVCVRIEEQIDGLAGIERIASTAAEGVCAVRAEVIAGADVDVVLSDIKNQVDAITTFPEQTEKPIVSKLTVKRTVADIAIYGGADERALKEIGERVRDEIVALPGITQVDLAFVRPYEVSIEVSEESLRRHGLTFSQVADAVSRSSLDLPGGSLDTPSGEILLRTKGQAYVGPDFEDIVVLTRPDGTRLRLGDVARVIDGFEEVDLFARFDGHPAVLVKVYRVGDQDLIEISDAVNDYIAQARPRLPEGVDMTLWKDGSVSLRLRIQTLLRNAVSGLVLVFGVLALFLRLRLAMWVGIGVPVAFLGAFTVLPFVDISIDVISLFAFILVLGILVDDAIVVAENVYSHEQRHGDRLRAASEGAQEVAVPVIFGVLTTVAAFMPLVVAPGPMGEVFAVMGLVVIACLMFSVVESQLVLPSHLSHGRTAVPPAGAEAEEDAPARGLARWGDVQRRFSGRLERFTRERYLPFLERAIEWRYLSISIGVGLLIVFAGVIAGGYMKFSFFPPVPADHATAYLSMPRGVPLPMTEQAVAQIEGAAIELARDLDERWPSPAGPVVRHRFSAIGSQPGRGEGHGDLGGRPDVASTHLAEVQLELLPSELREVSTRQVADLWRERVGEIPDAVELDFVDDYFSAGKAVEVELAGADTEELRAAAAWLKDRLAEYPGVVDLNDSFRLGKQEVRLALLPGAEPLGVRMRDLARQVRQAFYGDESQRIQRGRDDVRVMVRYPESERRSLGDLENLRIRTSTGAEVPLSTVARVELGRGYSSIEREDRRRVVDVTADVEREEITANEVYADLHARVFPELRARFPGIVLGIGGEQEEQTEVFGALYRDAALALLVIYALLAVPLRSYAQPLVIMSVIPFGLVGALAGHLLMRWLSPLWGGTFDGNLSFMSINGMMALSGVVVNASLVLVVYVNRRRAQGVEPLVAVREGAAARFRPIVLTAVTTFAGLSPLMLERSIQAQFLIPMAISLAYGVLFATGITLILVPCGYAVIEDVRGLPARLARRLRKRPGRHRSGSQAAPGVDPPEARASDAPAAGDPVDRVADQLGAVFQVELELQVGPVRLDRP